jgi:hypothetical protein
VLEVEADDLEELDARVAALRGRVDVVSARLVAELQADAFRVSGRDAFPDTSRPSSPASRSDANLVAAYANVRAFEAWQAVADSGRFDSAERFNAGAAFPVRIGVLDTVGAPGSDGQRTALSLKQLPDSVFEIVDTYTQIDAAENDHGLHVAAIIGARNVDEPLQLSTGIVGGVLPAGASPFYKILAYNLGTSQGRTIAGSRRAAC